jgi:phospholipase D1/2
MVDPERPMEPDELVKDFVPATERRPVAGRVRRVAIALIALAALAALWRYTPLRDFVSLRALIEIAHTLDESPVAPLAVLAAYVVAGLLVIPVTVLIIATGVVFGPLLGGFYALAGALLSAAVTYWIGSKLGRNTVRHLAGRRLNRITRRLAKKGALAIALIRLLPVAPFSIVNAVIGASHIRLRDFLLGTAFGMAPGIAVTVVFVDRVSAAVTDPGLFTYAGVVGMVAIVAAGAYYVHHRFAAATPPAAERV